MRRFVTAGLILLAGLSLGAPRLSAEIKWTSFENGLTRAHKEKKPILMDVYTDWCRWCKVMDSKTYSQKEIEGLISKRFVPVRMNGESKKKVVYQEQQYEEGALGKKLGVRGFPTTIFFDRDGNMIGAQAGYIEAPDFLKMLKYIESGAYRKTSFEQFTKGK